jgi:tetratricopeptide (TPR) repeat protein
VIGAGLSLLLCAAGIGWLVLADLWIDPDAQLQTARQHLAERKYAAAEEAAAKVLAAVPHQPEAALIAARAAVFQSHPQQAVDYAEQVPRSDRKRFVEAALLRAKTSRNSLHALSQAERAYRDALSVDPDNVEANTELATLLALCGRSREAVPFALKTIALGVPTDLVVLLSRENGIVNEAGVLEAASRSHPDDPLPLMGLAWHAASDGDHARAVELLTAATKKQPQLPAAFAALGEQLLEAGRFSELPQWYASLPEAARRLPESWLVLAQLAERNGDRRGALRSYLEASRIAPESKGAIAALARLFAADGDSAAADRFSVRVQERQQLEHAQSRVLQADHVDGVEPVLELAAAYEQVGRLWEALGWMRLATQMNPFDRDVRTRLEGLEKHTRGLPLKLTVDSANLALAIDASPYPLPRLVEPSAVEPTPKMALRPVSFRDDASAADLRFTYFNGTSGAPTKRMFEFTGGGIGVLDFDADGWPDVFFTQGCTWPPGSRSDQPSDVLYRNQDGRRFTDVSSAANVVDASFGQGVAVGDLDADGFADLYVANIGGSRLLRNNGDGTFADLTHASGVAGDEWTTSCAVADLDGDALPDLYAVNYVMSDDVFDRVCGDAATPRLCMPYDFEAQPDRVWKNNGDGSFSEATSSLLANHPPGKGLGVAIWDAFGAGRPNVLIANDTTPNDFFELDEHGQYVDRGIESGLALNADGKATGCMGIALGDVNDDGQLDIFITNFLAEANTYYTSSTPGFYEDRTREVDLQHPSFDVLGFGTQFLDADLDGRLELFVANGHIDDLRDIGKPYEMPAQVFRWDGTRFRESPAEELGPYFHEKWLGRAAARIDWNRDGRDDLLVGHLAKPSALLTNTTSSDHHFLQISLVGTQSNRDAIGTIVIARTKNHDETFQLTAGDGYQASNERRITIGCGSAEVIDELIIRWPSGLEQRFENVPADRFLKIIEGRRPLAIGQ